MNEKYEASAIWKKTLGKVDDTIPYINELKNSFQKSRENIRQLIQSISTDSVGLTIHDITHIDALWEMSDLLLSDTFEINPIECYVLGCSFLLHDSGLTLAAYNNGVDDIKILPEYSDAYNYYEEKRKKIKISNNNDPKLPTIEQLALSDTLRINHAEKASDLSTQSWNSPIDNKDIYLIDDDELREHYGHSIGLLSSSHHWNMEKVLKTFTNFLGPKSNFPNDWTVDLLKLAMILRCADAMHIDDRRAPKFSSALRYMDNISLNHWTFQNLITKPHIKDNRLVYTSKKPFNVENADAWNLCFDTLQMIDKEIKSSNETLAQKGIEQFKINSVAGANSANSLSNFIEVLNWKPLPLNLKVSNVQNLAKTLGGRDLYNNKLAPIRELIQNAADAIDARVLVEDEFCESDGKIFIEFKKESEKEYLIISDNGVGMSENVLTSSLLDFGFSFWKSKEAREEFPGLQSSIDRLRGRYGIGFFSVFMWANKVSVISRRFRDGNDNTKVLEFNNGIDSRPLLRPAMGDELTTKWSTKIKLELIDGLFEKDVHNESIISHRRYLHSRKARNFNLNKSSWIEKLKLTCGPLSINVQVKDHGKSENVSLPNWKTCDHNLFYDFFGNIIFEKNETNNIFIKTLSNLDSSIVQGGRCFISPYTDRLGYLALYEKGIFIRFGNYDTVSGIVETNSSNAARDRSVEFNIKEEKKWISSIKSKAFNSCNNIGEKIKIQKLLFSIDEFDMTEPLFINNRELITYNDLENIIKKNKKCIIKLSQLDNNGKKFEWKEVNSIHPILGLNVDKYKLYPLIDFNETIDVEDLDEDITESNSPFFKLLNDIKEFIGDGSIIEYKLHEKEGYKSDYFEFIITSR